jgi:hypothetical protein
MQISHTPVLASFIAVLLITFLLLGWVTIRIQPGSFIPNDSFLTSFMPRELINALRNDINLTVTVYDLSNSVKLLEISQNIASVSGASLPTDISSELRAAARAAGSLRMMI